MLKKIFCFFDDRANPYMVKELRQSVNNLLMLIILGGFLAWQPLALLIGYGEGRGNVARGVVAMQITGMVVFAFFALPIYLASICVNEKSYSYNMMYGTPMDAFSVVAGKLKAGMCMVLLAMSITLPCMFGVSVFRGVDMISVAWIGLFMLLYSTMNASYGIFLGLIRRRMVLFGFFALCYLMFFLPIEIAFFSGTTESLFEGATTASMILSLVVTAFVALIINAILLALAAVAVEPIVWT